MRWTDWYRAYKRNSDEYSYFSTKLITVDNIQIIMQHVTFQTITEQQQTEVLKYLEATNTEDLQAATQILHRHGFNSQQAISHRFSDSSPRSNHSTQRQHTVQQQQELMQYVRHLRETIAGRSVWQILFRGTKGILKGCFRSISNILLPECLKQRLLFSRFDRLYRPLSNVKCQSCSISELFEKSRYHDKPCAIFFVNSQKLDRTILQLMNKEDLVTIFNSRFVCYGVSSDQTNDLKAIRQEGRPLQSPSLIIAYQTILDKIQVLREFKLNDEETLKGFDVKILNNLITEYRAYRRRQRNIIIRYNNLVLSHWHDEAATELMEEQIPEDHSHYETDRMMVEQQQKQYEEAMRQSKLLEERRAKQKQQERKRQEALNLLQEERKVRKMSIPDQPTDGDIIKFSFRCPNGSRVVRSFQKGQTLQLIYHWVQTNDQIEFEDDQRRFQLLHGYPPVPLGDKKQQKLGNIFEQGQQQIVVKEL